MQAFFANFSNKLTLNFPQNIVHQIFHEMSNILYIPDFPNSPQIFQIFHTAESFRRFSAAVQDPQIFQIFQIFQTLKFSARFSASSFPDFPPDFPLYRIRQIFRRFSACQIFRQSASMSSFPHKKKDWFSSPFLINNLPPVLPEFFLPNSALPHSMPVWAFWRILF